MKNQRRPPADIVYALLGATLLVRLLLLLVQRSVGIDWDFHPDAVFYTDKIQMIRSDGILPFLLEGEVENSLFVGIGYLASTLTLELFSDQNILIALNLGLASLSTHQLALMAWESDGSTARKLVAPLFYAVSPYLSHIAIHPLKDVTAIYFTLLLFWSLHKENWASAAVIAGLLILTRFHFGVATTMSLVIWRLVSYLRPPGLAWPLVFFGLAASLYLAAQELLTDRLAVEFEGRDFYPNGLVLVPESLEVRLFLGWALNFLIPYPFIPTNTAEVGYFAHWALFIAALVYRILNLAGHRRDGEMNLGLVVACLFLFAFVLTTTPGAGPLVRYRLSVEVLMLVALFFPAQQGHSPKSNPSVERPTRIAQRS